MRVSSVRSRLCSSSSVSRAKTGSSRSPAPMAASSWRCLGNAGSRDDAEFAEHATNLIDQRGSFGHRQGADTMYGKHRLGLL